MATLTRRLSFGRRRSTTTKLPPKYEDTCDTSEQYAATTAATTPESSEADFALNMDKLRGCFHKKHRHCKGPSQWAKRHFEVDDFLEALLCFRSLTDMQRCTPAHVYPLAELLRVEKVETIGHEHPCKNRIEIGMGQRAPAPDPIGSRTSSPAASPRSDAGAPAETETLLLSCESADARTRWVRGLQGRMVQTREAQRTHELRRLVLDKSRDASPNAPARHLGVTISNWDASSLGVLVEAVVPGDLAYAAGLRGGDVLICVGHDAVYSHTQALELLSQAVGDVDLLVRQPRVREQAALAASNREAAEPSLAESSSSSSHPVAAPAGGDATTEGVRQSSSPLSCARAARCPDGDRPDRLALDALLRPRDCRTNGMLLADGLPEERPARTLAAIRTAADGDSDADEEAEESGVGGWRASARGRQALHVQRPRAVPHQAWADERDDAHGLCASDSLIDLTDLSDLSSEMSSASPLMPSTTLFHADGAAAQPRPQTSLRPPASPLHPSAPASAPRRGASPRTRGYAAGTVPQGWT